MLGLQGKSVSPANPSQKERAPFSRSASGGISSRGSSSRGRQGGSATFRMSTNGSTGIPSRSSSILSEEPEKLSRGPSPYQSKMSTNLTSTTNRRVQSAATARQRSNLGPTVKASELFRKNSEPQLTKLTRPGTATLKVNKNTKHVRIGTASEPEDVSSVSMKTTAAVIFRERRGGSVSADQHTLQRRPFSFCSDRSRSVSVASVVSNESTSTCDNEEIETEMGSGDASLAAQWARHELRQSVDNNNVTTASLPLIGGHHPRLSKRTYSMDSTLLSKVDFDDNSNSNSPLLQDFRAQMIEMKISEQPEEALREDNGESRRESLGTPSSLKHTLNTTFSEESGGKTTSRKSSEFDRMLLLQSDNILRDVSDLMDELKIGDRCNGKRSTPSLDTRTESVERLVRQLQCDLSNQISSTSLSLGTSGTPKKFGVAPDERFNFNCLDLSGIELADISCPQQVMDQSVPNSSRMDGSMSASGIFGGPSDGTFSLAEEAEKYRLMNMNIARPSVDKDDGDESSDSNNQTFSNEDGLPTVQQVQGTSVGSEEDSSASAHSDFEMDAEEIQKKICSALKLLEEEDKKVRGRHKSGSSHPGMSARSSMSIGISASNPDSRAESRGEEDDGTTPRPSPNDQDRPRSFSENRPSRKSECLGVKGECSYQRGPEVPSGSRSARSCSCLLDHKSIESLDSARSNKTTLGFPSSAPDRQQSLKGSSSDYNLNNHNMQMSASKSSDGTWVTKDDKTKQIFSFLDEVEKTDQEMLFGLRFETDGLGRLKPSGGSSRVISVELMERENSAQTGNGIRRKGSESETQFRTMDGLIRKGSVELAREILLLERKLDEGQHAVKLLEESLLNQRELNIRNMRNSERDFKKRMRLQKEEFDLAFSRNEALINEMASEKRSLQEKLDKLIKNFEEMEEKHKEQMKSIQHKHLDEIRRLRKMQQSAENTLKQKIAGNKAQAHEIREMTVKGLEPEVQRIIQRHQQEMSEMRAWHSDEMRETEERCQRKIHMMLQDLREKFGKEKEDAIMREREVAQRRLVAELKQKDEELDAVKKRCALEIQEERERLAAEEIKLRESIQESLRKCQVKGEVELENLRKEMEAKMASLEKRHESELKSLKDVHEAERMNLVTSQGKKLESALSEQEVRLKDNFQGEKEKDWRDKEKKLREEFEKFRKDDEEASESRFRRMQEKLQFELREMERTERDVKGKLTQSKSELLAREEELFALKTSLSVKEKQMVDLQEMNLKMQEERVNLTSVIRREFTDQIQGVEEECRNLKASIVEIQSNGKIQLEQKQLEMEKMLGEKDGEIEKIGLRVRQALGRKDETISELQKQLEKCSYQIGHLEELLEEQRKEFLHSVKMPSGGPRKK